MSPGPGIATIFSHVYDTYRLSAENMTTVIIFGTSARGTGYHITILPRSAHLLLYTQPTPQFVKELPLNCAMASVFAFFKLLKI